MRITRTATFLAGALMLAVGGCVPSLPSSYHCAADRQCISHGVAGVCELPQGACSFPDGSCASGKRYGSLGAPTYAGMCVPSGDAGVGGPDLGGAGGGGDDGGGVIIDMASTDMATSKTITRVGTSDGLAAMVNSQPAMLFSRPSAAATGDLLFVSIFADNNNVTVTPATGWMVTSDQIGVTGGAFRATWLYHFVGAGESASYLFLLSGNPQTTAGELVAYRNVATPPIDVSIAQVFEAAAFVAPSITTTHTNDMLLAMFVNASTATQLSWTAPAGMATAVNQTNIGMFDQLQAAAGATGTKQATFGVNVPGVGAVDFVALTPLP